MQFAQFLAAVHLCCLTAHVRTTSALFPFRNSKSPQKKVGAAALLTSRGGVDRTSSKRLPKYLMKLFLSSQKALTDDVNTIRGVFPTSKLTVFFFSLPPSNERPTLETLDLTLSIAYSEYNTPTSYAAICISPLHAYAGYGEHHVYVLSRLRMSCDAARDFANFVGSG